MSVQCAAECSRASLPPCFVTAHSSVGNTLNLGEYQTCLRTRMVTVLLSTHGPIIEQNALWDTLC